MYVEGKLLGEAVNRLYISDILAETELGGMYGILVGTLLKPDGRQNNLRGAVRTLRTPIKERRRNSSSLKC